MFNIDTGSIIIIVTHIQQLQMVDFSELHSQVSEIRVKMMIAKEAERKLKGS